MTILGTVESRFLRIHQTIYEATRGTVGHRLIGVATLLLTSTGRRTGRPRVAALVYAKDDDGSLIVTASNGGADRSPGWLYNVKADGSVEVQIGRRRFGGGAEVPTPRGPTSRMPATCSPHAKVLGSSVTRSMRVPSASRSWWMIWQATRR